MDSFFQSQIRWISFSKYLYFFLKSVYSKISKSNLDYFFPKSTKFGFFPYFKYKYVRITLIPKSNAFGVNFPYSNTFGLFFLKLNKFGFFFQNLLDLECVWCSFLKRLKSFWIFFLKSNIFEFLFFQNQIFLNSYSTKIKYNWIIF